MPAQPLSASETRSVTLGADDAAQAVAATIEKLYPFVTADQAGDAAESVLAELRAHNISLVRSEPDGAR